MIYIWSSLGVHYSALECTLPINSELNGRLYPHIKCTGSFIFISTSFTESITVPTHWFPFITLRGLVLAFVVRELIRTYLYFSSFTLFATIMAIVLTSLSSCFRHWIVATYDYFTACRTLDYTEDNRPMTFAPGDLDVYIVF